MNTVGIIVIYGVTTVLLPARESFLIFVVNVGAAKMISAPVDTSRAVNEAGPIKSGLLPTSSAVGVNPTSKLISVFLSDTGQRSSDQMTIRLALSKLNTPAGIRFLPVKETFCGRMAEMVTPESSCNVLLTFQKIR